jgi:hypothetical protein
VVCALYSCKSNVTTFECGSVCLAVYMCIYKDFLSPWVCYLLAWTASLSFSVPCCVVEVLEEESLHSVVHFPTRISTTTQTLIDNIFVDTTKFLNYFIHLVFNGLSHHDDQLLSLQQQEFYWKKKNPNHKTIRITHEMNLNLD